MREFPQANSEIVEDVWNQSRHDPEKTRASLLEMLHGASPGLDSSLEGQAHRGGDAWPQEEAGGAAHDRGRVHRELMRAGVDSPNLEARTAREAREHGDQRARQQSEAASSAARGQPSFLHHQHVHQPHASPARVRAARASQDPLVMLQEDYPELDAFVVEQVRG